MKLGQDLRRKRSQNLGLPFLQLVSPIMFKLTVVRKHKSIYGLRKRQKVILRGQNVLSKVSWEAHLGPSPLQKNFQTPDPHSRINQMQPPSYFNAMIMLLGPFTKVRLWAFQFGSLTTKEGHRHPRNSRSNRQARQIGRRGQRSFSLGKWRPQKCGSPAEEASRQQSQLF